MRGAKALPKREEFVKGMARTWRRNAAATRVAPPMSRIRDCVLCMVGRRNSAATMGALTMSRREEFVVRMARTWRRNAAARVYKTLITVHQFA